MNNGALYFLCGNNTGGENLFNTAISTLKAAPYNLSTTGGWNHIGWSISKTGSWIITINGQNLSYTTPTANLSSMVSTSPIYLLTEDTRYGTQWNGNIDEFQLYKTALTYDELRYLYLYP
jgi:hypothetical protein